MFRIFPLGTADPLFALNVVATAPDVEIVIPPAVFAIEIPLPGVNVAATGSFPVEPISSWPFVKVIALIALVPSPTNTPCAVNDVRPVPPYDTTTGEARSMFNPPALVV